MSIFKAYSLFLSNKAINRILTVNNFISAQGLGDYITNVLDIWKCTI